MKLNWIPNCCKDSTVWSSAAKLNFSYVLDFRLLVPQWVPSCCQLTHMRSIWIRCVGCICPSMTFNIPTTSPNHQPYPATWWLSINTPTTSTVLQGSLLNFSHTTVAQNTQQGRGYRRPSKRYLFSRLYKTQRCRPCIFLLGYSYLKKPITNCPASERGWEQDERETISKHIKP